MELFGAAIVVVGLGIGMFAKSQEKPGSERDQPLMNVAIAVIVAGVAVMGFVENFYR
jgi:hypothetical protein